MGDQGGPGDESPGVLIDTVRAVWGVGATEVTRRPRTPPGTSDWMVLPRFGAPRWLLPAGGRGTARALLGSEAAGVRRVAVQLLVAGHRLGLGRRLPVRRVRVRETSDDSLESTLRRMAGADVEVAVRLGSWRHARSVVVRLFDHDGTTVAFGKVGIDHLGCAAVATEAAALSRVGELDLTQVVTSEVLGHDTWRGLDLLLVSPLLSPQRGSDGPPPVAAMLELARAGGARTAPLADSAWWTRTRRRVDEVADPTTRHDLGSHLDRLGDAAGALPVQLGPSHGDWTPWNMSRAGSRVLLWDWEHYVEDVPVGFDLVHYLAQELRVTGGTGPEAEARWLTRAHEALDRELGLGREVRDVVLAAYLLDVNLRFVLDRQATPQAGEQRNGWGLGLLRRQVTGLGVVAG